MKRYLQDQVARDLDKKMVFVGGPRQVGKTTLALAILAGAPGYLNWDVPEMRQAILRRTYPESSLLVFDEIHKYRSWRNYLKGLYDNPSRHFRILVTGSARLDLYRFGGDSLQGRYHYLRLHPLSAAELKLASQADFEQLLALGGFPEPFLSGSSVEAKRWSREYSNRLIREEIISLEQVIDLGNIELLLLRLPELVGAPLSVNALREDLQLNHATVSKWLEIFERIYAIFRLPPYGSPRIKAVKKERKHYHFDWSVVESKGPRFENLVACHLLKWVHFEQDVKGRDVQLCYLRDTTGREVDFVITEKGKPFWMVECKYGDDQVSQALSYYARRFPSCLAWQISAVGTKDFRTADGIRVCPALRFLKELV